MAHLLIGIVLFCYPSNFNFISRRTLLTSGIGMSIIGNTKTANANDDEETGLIRGFNNNLYYSGPMTDSTIFTISSNLMAMQYEKNLNEINLHMQSIGGSLMPSLSLVDLITKF